MSRKFKNILKLALSLMMVLTHLRPLDIQATNEPTLGFVFKDFDPGEGDEAGGPETIIPVGGTVVPGQVIQVDLEYMVAAEELQFMLLNFNFDSEHIEMVPIVDGFPEYGVKFIPEEVIKKGGFFPQINPAINTRWTQNIAQVKTGNVSATFTGQSASHAQFAPVTKAGTLVSLFFKVKEGVAPNTEINFTFNEKSLTGGGPVVFTHVTKLGNTDILPKIVNGKLTVAGDNADENHSLSSLKANGAVKGTTYDYLEGLTPSVVGNESSYEFVVPNDVANIAFDAVFEDPSAGTQIKHNKTNASGTPISGGMSLEVGDNYFTSVVTAQGATIESYKYKIKRLNNKDYAGSGTTNAGASLVFNQGNSNTVDVLGNTTYVDMNGSPDGDVAFSSHGGSSVAGSRITVDQSKSQTQFKVVYTPEAWRTEYNNVPGINASNRGNKIDAVYTLNYLSSNTEISKLTLKNTSGTELGSSSESKDRYDFTVPGDTTTVNLEVLFKMGAVVSNGNLSNVVLSNSGPTTIKFTAKAKDSTTKEYTVVVTKEKKTNNDLSSLSLKIDGVEQINTGSGINQDINIVLDHNSIGKTAILAAGVDASTGAVIISGGNANKVLTAGDNEFKIVVKAEDGSEKTYTVTVSLGENTESDLEGGLTPTDPETPLEEDKDKETDDNIDGVQTKNLFYNVEVPFSKDTYGKSDLTFTAPSGAQVSYEPSEEINLVIGANTYKLVVLSQDGKSKTIYNITITRNASSEIEDGVDVNDKDSLVDPDTPITGEKDKDQTEDGGIFYDVYRYNIAVKHSKLTFGMDDLSFKAPTGSTIIGGETPINLVVGNKNTYEFVVKSSDGKSHSKYIFTIDRAANSSSQIEGDIKPGTGSEDWLNNPADSQNPIEDNSIPNEKDAMGNIYRHRIEVAYSKTQFEMKDLTFKLPDGAVTTGGALINLAVGDNEFKFVVTSPDKTTKSTYIITVNRAQNSNSEVDGGINPGDDVEWPVDPSNPIIPDDTKDTEVDKDGVITKTFNYIINVKNEITSFDGTKDLKFDVPTNAQVVYSPAGAFDLSVGSKNSLTITITSEDGKSVTNYVYTIIREGSKNVDVVVKPDSDKHQITNNGNYDYTVWVPKGTKSYGKNSFKLELTEGQTVTYENDSDLDISTGLDTYKYIFTVHAQDGLTTQKYTLNIKFLEDENTNPKLTSVSVDGVDITDFSPDLNNQTIDLDPLNLKDLDKFVFESFADAEIAVDPASVEVKFTKGQTSVSQVVTLTSDQGVNFYKFTFIRTPAADSSLPDLDTKDDEWLVYPDLPLVGEKDEEKTEEDGILYEVYRYKVKVVTSKETFGMDDITFTKPAGSTIIGGDTPINLVIGDGNTFEFVVESSDKKSYSKYIFTIDRASDDNAKLEGDITPGTGSEDWLEDPSDANKPIEDQSKPGESDAVGNIYRYRIEVAYSKLTFNMDDLTYTLPKGAEITGGDQINLSLGDNEFRFTVTSPDKTTKSTYIITVNRAQNSDSEIEDGVKPGDGGDEWVVDPTDPIIPDEDKDNETEKDGVTTKNLNFIINVKNSKETFDGTKDLTFDKPENSVVTYNPAGSFPLAVGSNNKLTITVTSENGKSITNYIYTIIREGSSDSEIGDVKPGEDGDDWLVDKEDPITEDKPVEENKEDGVTTKTHFYTIHVKNSKETFNGMNGEDLLFTIPIGSEVIYSPQGEFALIAGNNTLTITVTSGDKKFVTKHIYTIIREKGDSAHVDVESNNSQHQLADNGNYDYTVWVPKGTKVYGKSSIKLTQSEGQTVNYPTDLILQDDPSVDKYIFTVTSQDGLITQTYTINVIIESDGIENPKLKSISIDGVTVDNFNPDATNLTIDLGDYTLIDKDKFTFESFADVGIAVDPQSVVINFVKGQSTMTQIVTLTTLQSVNFYKFTFVRALSRDNSLSDIIVNNDEGIQLTPEFTPGNSGPYEVNLPADSDSVTITPKPADPNASVDGGGNVDLVPGDNNVVIKVTPEDGPSQDYNIVVKVALAVDELSIGNVVVVDVDSGVLEGTTLTYTIDEPLPSDMYEAYIHVVANHDSVKITGQANKDITLDNKDIKFKLTARDGKTILNVVVKYTRTLDSNAKLAQLDAMIDGVNKVENFRPDELEYSFDVDYDFDTLVRDLHLILKAEVQTTRISAPERISIGNGLTTTYRIETIAEDGSTLTYKLNITRPANNFIENLFIKDGKGHIEGEFDRNVTDYDATVYPGSDTFNFGWITAKGITIVNEADLKDIPTSSLPKTFEIQVKGDGESVRIYKVAVDKARSTRLKSLETSVGLIDFKPEVTDYTVYVPLDTRHITLSNVVAEYTGATINGDYVNVELLQDETAIVITVSEGTNETVYTVTVKKVADETSIDKIVVNDGPNRWVGTENSDGSFEVEVGSDTKLEDLEIDVILGFPEGKYEISEGVTNADGEVEYVITVTDKNGASKEYDLTIKQGKSDNNFLEELKINGESVTGFNRWNQTYTYKVTDETFTIEGTPEDEKALVAYDYTEPLVNGLIVKVSVTSQKGDIRVYEVTIEKEKENTAILESLSVKQAAFSPSFNKLQNQYYMTIPYELDTLTVVYTAAGKATAKVESNRTVNGNDVSGIEVGSDNQINVVVEAEDGSTFTYIIHVTRNAESNNFLDALTVANSDDHGLYYDLSPNFSKDIMTYTVRLPKDVNSVFLEGALADLLRVHGLGDVNMNQFPYSHEIRVLDEQNVSRSYFITFLQEASEVVTLANLTTDKGPLDPVFEANRFVYNVDVEYDVTDIVISYTKNEEDQVVTGDGLHILKPGRNEIQVTVKSGNNSQVYTIFVNRAKVSTPGLDWLEVSEGTLSPVFDPKTKTYHVVVDEAVENVTINAGSHSDEVVVDGSGLKELNLGHNLFEITVDAGAGVIETYYVVINRGEVDNLLLAHLSIDQETLNEIFDPLVTEYTSDLLLSSYELLPVRAIAQNPDATVTITGVTDLGMGEHAVTIRVAKSETEFADTTITVTIGMRMLESDIHVVGPDYIATVKNEQTVAQLKDQMLNDNAHLRVYAEGEVLEEGDLVGTGAIIKLVIDDVEYDSKIIIVSGDVNGDSEITVADIMMTQSKILGSTLSDIQMLAADVNQDDDVTVADFMMIQAHILTQIDIHETQEENGDE